MQNLLHGSTDVSKILCFISFKLTREEHDSGGILTGIHIQFWLTLEYTGKKNCEPLCARKLNVAVALWIWKVFKSTNVYTVVSIYLYYKSNDLDQAGKRLLYVHLNFSNLNILVFERDRKRTSTQKRAWQAYSSLTVSIVEAMTVMAAKGDTYAVRTSNRRIWESVKFMKIK